MIPAEIEKGTRVVHISQGLVGVVSFWQSWILSPDVLLLHVSVDGIYSRRWYTSDCVLESEINDPR